jgi:hypothetical protein
MKSPQDFHRPGWSRALGRKRFTVGLLFKLVIGPALILLLFVGALSIQGQILNVTASLLGADDFTLACPCAAAGRRVFSLREAQNMAPHPRETGSSSR